MEQETANGYSSKNFSLAIVVIFFTMFASSMASVSPVSFLLKNLSGTGDAFTVLIAALTSISSVAVISGNFSGGFLAHRSGNKKVIAAGSSILAFSLFGYMLFANVFWILAVFFVQMFSISLFQPAFTALVASTSELCSRGKAFGHFYLWMIGPSIPAPFVGGLLVDNLGLQFSFIAAGMVSLVALIGCFRLLTVPNAPKSPDEFHAMEKEETTSMSLVNVLFVFGILSLFAGFSTGLLLPLNRLYPIEILHANATELGLVFSIGSGLATALVQIPGGMLADRFGRKRLVLLSVLGAPFVVAMAYTSSLTQFILAATGVFAFGNIGSPAYSAWQMELVPSSKRAFASGLINGLSGVGMFVGPLVSIWLWQFKPNVSIAFFTAALSWIIQIPPILMLRETRL